MPAKCHVYGAQFFVPAAIACSLARRRTFVNQLGHQRIKLLATSCRVPTFCVSVWPRSQPVHPTSCFQDNCSGSGNLLFQHTTKGRHKGSACWPPTAGLVLNHVRKLVAPPTGPCKELVAPPTAGPGGALRDPWQGDGGTVLNRQRLVVAGMPTWAGHNPRLVHKHNAAANDWLQANGGLKLAGRWLAHQRAYQATW